MMVIAQQTQDPALRTAGWANVVFGVLGAVGAAYLAMRTPAVSAEQWSYPQRGGEYVITQVFFAVCHVVMVWALLAIARSDALPRTKAARIGSALAIGGMGALAVNELLAVIPRNATVDSTAAGVVGALYGVITLVLAAGLITMGVALARHAAWPSPDRWILLMLGVWLLVPTMPALAMNFTAARLSLLAWSLMGAWLGWAMTRRRS